MSKKWIRLFSSKSSCLNILPIVVGALGSGGLPLFGLVPLSNAESLSQKDAKLEYVGIGKPSFLKVHGESKNGVAQLTTTPLDAAGNQTVKGTVTVALATFSSGIALRDKHTQEKIFESAQFPNALLTLDELKFLQSKKGTIDFSGTLNFHGVTKPVKGTVEITSQIGKLEYDAKFSIQLTDFGIKPPEYMGMTIQNNVEIEAKGKAVASN